MCHVECFLYLVALQDKVIRTEHLELIQFLSCSFPLRVYSFPLVYVAPLK